MGHMTVLVLLNDRLDDSQLHSNIHAVLEKVTHGEESHAVGGVKGFRSFHADETKVFVVGQNTARALLPSPQNVPSTADADAIFHALAEALGYAVRKRTPLPKKDSGTKLRINLEPDKEL